MIVSPTESDTFKSKLSARSSWKPEAWGCDALWAAKGRWFGVQRKALKDLVASVEDGRLAKEMMQWESLSGGVWFIVETGERGGAGPRELPGGGLVGLGTFGRPWTGTAFRSLVTSVACLPIVNGVVLVKDEDETIARVKELEDWTRKEHGAWMARGSAPMDVFGERGAKEYGVHVLTSLPGVGVELAGRIWDRFGGLPMRMTVTEKELMGVDGVGKVKARKIMGIFGGE